MVLFGLLAARGVAVDPPVEARLRDCADLDRLRGWVEQVIAGATVDELR